MRLSATLRPSFFIATFLLGLLPGTGGQLKAQYGFVYHEFWGPIPAGSFAPYTFPDLTIDASGSVWVPNGNLVMHQVPGGWDTLVAPLYVAYLELDENGMLWVQCILQQFSGTNPVYLYDGTNFILKSYWDYSDELNKVLHKSSDGHIWVGNCRFEGGVVDSCLYDFSIGLFGWCYSFAAGNDYEFFYHEGCMSCNNFCSSLTSNVSGINGYEDSLFCDQHHYPTWGGNEMATDPEGRFWVFHSYSSCCSANAGGPNNCTNVCISRFANGSWSYYTDLNRVLDEDWLYGVLVPPNGASMIYPARPGYDTSGNAWSAFHHLFMMDSLGNATTIPNSNHIYPATREVLVAPDNTVWFGGVWDSAGVLHHGLVSFQQPGCDVHTYNVPAHICQGSTYMLGNTPLTTDGYYEDTLTNLFGCDSIVHLTLTTHPAPASSYQQQTICANESYDFYGTALSSSGNYSHVLTGQYGCDSTVVLSLFVLPVSATDTSQQICTGSSYYFFGANLTTSGTYTHTLLSANGCDSIITLNLTVSPPPVTTLVQQICSNESFTFYGANLVTSGTYTHTLQAANGCDSIITLQLSVTNPVNDTIHAAICTGDTYPFYGANLNFPGSYYQVLTNPFFCDTTIFLELMVNPNHLTSMQQQICQGDSVNFYGSSLFEGGSFYHTLSNVYGCDSVIQLNLAVYLPTLSIIQGSIAAGSTYDFNGQQLSQAGNYYDTLTNAEGCDSIIKLELSITNSTHEMAGADVELRIWPNPANDVLNLEWNSSGEGQQACITNALGEEVLCSTLSLHHHQFAIRHLPSGIYLLRLGAATARFLKE